MEAKKIAVQFSAAPKTYDPRGNAGVVNQMWATATDADGSEIELYAEIDWPEPYSDPESPDYDEVYGYDELKAEIISQAREHGIPAEVLNGHVGLRTGLFGRVRAAHWSGNNINMFLAGVVIIIIIINSS